MTAALGRRLDLGTANRPVWAGWSGVALGVFAWIRRRNTKTAPAPEGTGAVEVG